MSATSQTRSKAENVEDAVAQAQELATAMISRVTPTSYVIAGQYLQTGDRELIKASEYSIADGVLRYRRVGQSNVVHYFALSLFRSIEVTEVFDA